MDLSFYRNKKVFITGHTGFKGAWLSHILLAAGANVTGYSLPAPTTPSLYHIAGLDGRMHSRIGDIADFAALKKAYDETQPEIVFHLAAQPIVRESYSAPLETYRTNVMGTVNLLECIRLSAVPPKSVLNITTDKVYKNREWVWGYREDEMLDGFDPYSNSKSCSELVTHSYKSSFFSNGTVALSTARAGNVIGGGDFAKDRIIPDCIRAVTRQEKIMVRNPASVRPYQHVLESLGAYLLIAQKQFLDRKYAGWYNVGPDSCDCLTTGELVELFCQSWGDGACWAGLDAQGPHESTYLRLDCSKLKNAVGWQPRWHVRQAVEKTVQWVKEWQRAGNPSAVMDRQIAEFFND